MIEETEESGWVLLGRAIRGLLLLVISFGSCYMAVIAALDGEWNKGIFFLIVMAMTDKTMDRMYKSRWEKKK